MVQRLHAFWFEPAPAARLAFLRILIGGFVLWYLIPQQDNFLQVAGSDTRLFAPVGVVFHGPVGVELFRWLMRGTIVAVVFLTLGLWHRVTGPVCAGLALWLFCYRHSWMKLYHSDNVVVFHLIVLGLSRSADALSLDALIRRWRQPGVAAASLTGSGYGWPMRLMCALIVSTYFLAAVAKLAGPLGLGWMSGENLRSQMAIDCIRKEVLGDEPNAVAYALYDRLPLFTVLAVGSLALEFFAPIALFNRRLGRLWSVNTFLMHWGIFFVMHITFHYQLTGLMFAPFFRVERLLELPRRLRWRRAAAFEAPAPVAAPGLSVAPGAVLASGERVLDTGSSTPKLTETKAT
ncbi:MAG TPA: hypothetical protein VFT34_11590 [Verrucomicrobiae bacterium]|nr:hypothetical protein [Verrucomicrobiae bacterium]